MGPREWTNAFEAALERVPLRRRPAVRAMRVTPGGYRVILHHNELTHRLLMQALLDRPEVSRIFSSWDAASGPLAICFTFGGDDIHEAEEMITIDARGARPLDPVASRQRLDTLTDEGPEAWFRRTIGAAIPFSLPRRMIQCDATAWETPGAADALGGLPMTPVKPSHPTELTIIGYYGAAGGQAIYYICSEGSHYTFLRLHFEGGYGSADQDRRYITAYLRGYARFRDRTRARLSQSILIHNEGTTTLKVAIVGSEPSDDLLIEVPCSSWKEAEESFEALFDNGGGAS